MKRLTISFVLFIFFVLIIMLAQSLFAQAPTNPTNNATGVSQGLTHVTWSDFYDGNGDGPYDVEFDDDPLFGSKDASDYSTVSTSLTLPLLNYNTKYYWRVRDTDTDGSGEDGPWYNYSFTTILATPVLISPASGLSFSFTSPVHFTWNQADNKTNVRYTIDVSTHGGVDFDPNIIHTYTTVINPPSSSHSFAITHAGVYYWRVKAIVDDPGADNNGETRISSIFQFTMTLPGPTLVSPINGVTGVSVLPTMVWNSVTGAVSYKLYVDDENTFDSPIYVNNEGTNTSKTFNALIPNFPLINGQRYYWKVAAIDAGGNEFPSSTRHFTVAPGFMVDQHTPSTGQRIQSTSVILGWSIGHSAQNLTFEIQYMNSLTTPTAESHWVGALTTTVNGGLASSYTEQISGLTLGKTYYWRVLIKRTSTGEYVYYRAPDVYNYFITEGGLTVTVTPNWPKDYNYVYTNTPRLDWVVNGYAADLTYQVRYRRTGGSWTESPDNITNLYYNIPSNLYPGETYEWQVRAKYGSDYTPWSSSAYFIVYGPGTLQVPTPNYPRDGAIVYTNTPRLDWVLTTSGAGLGYQIAYVASTTFPGVDGNGRLNGATDYPASGPFSSNMFITISINPGETIWWQVRSYSAIIDDLIDGIIDYDNEAFSAWSSTTWFVNNGPGVLVVPTPNWPIGGVMIYNTNPQLSWYLNPWSTGLTFELDIAAHPGLLDGSPDITGITNMYYYLSGSPGVTYSWRVRSRNSLGNTSAWSAIGSFTIVGGTTLSYAVAGWPIGGTTVYSNTPWLSWYLQGSQLGLTGWNVKYKKDSPPDDWISYNPTVNDTNGGKFLALPISTYGLQLGTVFNGLIYGATYHWAVYPEGATSVNPLGIGSFVIVGGPGSTTIVLSSPAHNSIVNSTSVYFNWYVNGSSLGIVDYQLQYSYSDVFDSAATTTVSAITAQNYLATGLLNGHTYYWRVRARYADHTYTAFSSVFSFTVQQGSSLVVQPWVGDPHNVVLTVNSPTFSWILPAPPAPGLKYELQYSTNINFMNSVTITDIPQQFVTVSNLMPNTQYFWRVRSKSSDGTYSYFSNLGRFGIESTTSVDEKVILPERYLLHQNFPNPFNPKTTIRFDLPVQSLVTVKIYNLVGQEVLTVVDNEMLSAGAHSRIIDLNALPSGMYLYKLETPNYSATRKMILVK